MKIFRLTFLLVLPLLLVSSAMAQNQTFTVDPAASQVGFTVGGSHVVKGTFHVQSGAIDFDPGAGKIDGFVVVATGSGNSGEASRDKRMSGQVLDAPHFAETTFVPHSYTGTIAGSGDSTIQVSGTFTLHGTGHEIIVPMQIHIEGGNCTAKGQFQVPYVDWGMKAPSMPFFHVDKIVGIDLTLVGTVARAKGK
jgi:polyisoprenoid-binding protein YceI